MAETLEDIDNVDQNSIKSGFDMGLNPGVVIPKEFFKDTKGGPSQYGVEPTVYRTLVTTAEKNFKIKNDIDYYDFDPPPLPENLLKEVKNNINNTINRNIKIDRDKYDKTDSGNTSLVYDEDEPPPVYNEIDLIIKGIGLLGGEGQDWYAGLIKFREDAKEFINNTIVAIINEAFDAAADALKAAADTDGYKQAKDIIHKINSYLPEKFKFPELNLLEKINGWIFDKDWLKAIIEQRNKVDENLPHKYYNAEIMAIKNLLRGQYFGDGKFREAIAESLNTDQFWNLNDDIPVKEYGKINQAARGFGVPQLVKESSELGTETASSRKNYTIEWKMASLATDWSTPNFDMDDENDPHHFNSSFAYKRPRAKFKLELDDIKSNTILSYLKQNRDPTNIPNTIVLEKSINNFKKMYYLGKDIQERTNIAATTGVLKLGSLITRVIEGETAEDTQKILTHETLGGDLISLFNGQEILGLYEEIADLAIRLYKKMAPLSPLDEENANQDSLDESLNHYLGVDTGKNKNDLLPLSIKVLINGYDKEGNNLGQLQKQESDFTKSTGRERNVIFVDIQQRKEPTATTDAQQNVKVYISDKVLGPFNNFNLSINSPVIPGFNPDDPEINGNGPYLNRINKPLWTENYSRYNNLINEYERIKNNSVKSLLKAFPDFYSNMFDVAIVWVENYDDVSLTFNSDKNRKLDDENNKTWLNFLLQMPSDFQNPNKYISINSPSTVNPMVKVNTTSVKIASEGFSVRIASVEMPQGISEVFETSFMTTKISRVASKVSKEHKSVLSMDVDQELYYADCINALAAQYSMTVEKVFNPVFDKISMVQQNKYLKNLFPYIMIKKTGHWNIYVNMINLSPMQDYIDSSSVITENKKMPVYVFEDVKFLGQNEGFSFTRDSASKLIAQFPFIYRRDYKIDLIN